MDRVHALYTSVEFAEELLVYVSYVAFLCDAVHDGTAGAGASGD